MKKPSCGRRAPVSQRPRRTGRHVLTFVTTGACLMSPVMAQADDATIDTLTITATSLYDNIGYTRRTTGAGTRMNLAPKEIPQTVSIMTEQRLKDQNLETIEDALMNTTGISVRRIDSDRVQFFARGFNINSYQYDGIPTLNTDGRWYFGEGALNTAIYDRIEVVRGANGLMTGAGNPGASVNFVRKHADSRELTGSVSGTLGSWDKQRGVVDVTTPLTESGDVRARFIGGYEDRDSYLDRYGSRKKFGYGIIDADVTENTTVSVGYDYQNTHNSSPTWGGFPLWYSDGGRTDYTRSFSPAPDWSRYEFESEKVFAGLEHHFANNWQLRGNVTHEKTNMDGKLAYLSGFPDRTTGQGVSVFPGWNRGERKVDSVDAYANGPFELMGRQHELVFGGSYSKQSNDYEGRYDPVTNTYPSGGDTGNFNDWNGSLSQPDWAGFAPSESASTQQKSVYTAARLSLADPVTLIVGARYTDWTGRSWANGTGNDRQSQSEVTPYGGLIYDINDTWSAFASYTEIFQPQDYLDFGGSYLEPIVGKNYETGVKAAWYDGLVNASFSVFRIEQDNVGEVAGQLLSGGRNYYSAAQGVVSKGFDAEVTGAVTDNLDMTAGFTHYTATDDEGAFSTGQPRTQANLFASYRVPQWEALTVGGGFNWQSHIFERDVPGPQGNEKVEQGSYTLVNLFGRYAFTKDLALQVNVRNLFDKKYYSYLDGYGVYGEPMNITSTLTYSF